MQTNVSNSPELGHAPKPSKTSGRLGIGWILGTVAVGIVTGAIGTVMHLNSFWTGSFGIPWGVALAILVAGLGQWWTGLMTANMLAPGLTGISQYATLAALTGLLPGDHFSVALNAQTWQFVPHLVIATLVWHAGIVILTMISVLLVSRQVRRIREQATERDDYSGLHSSATAWDNR
ncbi:hypothetical protein [Yaniella halotolerans]|uniref:hypothetical protein n=1 Tax=Yaniella halotolerans TaxID=225453 RepID=UPI0003B3CFE3|nr:hypothetical protein [Yaniella halotolerans]